MEKRKGKNKKNRESKARQVDSHPNKLMKVTHRFDIWDYEAYILYYRNYVM